MKTDKLAYLWMQEAPQGFFALIGRDKSDAAHYDFKSVEVKESAFRLDGAFIPKNDDITYFVEVQFQRDEKFYERVFAQVAIYIRQFGSGRWRIVAIYPTRGTEQTNLRAFEELLETRLIQRVYLDELPSLERLDSEIGIFKLALEPEPTVIRAAKDLIERAPERLDFIERVLFYKFRNLTRKEILKMLGIKEEFEEELKKTRAYQEILKEGREKGKKEGKKQGKKEGVLEGKLQAVPLLRELGISDEVIAKRLGLPLEKVKKASSK